MGFATKLFHGQNSSNFRQTKRQVSAAMIALAAVGVVAGMAGVAQAANATWNGTTDSTWAGTTNWSASPVPGTGNTATFNNAGNAHTVIDLGAGVTISNITFDTALAAAYTIGSGAVGSQTLTLNNGGVIVVNSTVANNELVNANITLGTDATQQTYTLTNNSTSNSLTLAGNFAPGTGGTAGTKTLSVSGAGATLISGNISGAVALSKSGNGTLTLTGANTYTSSTTINAGTLKIDFSASAQTTNIINNSANSSALSLAGGTLNITGASGVTNSQRFASTTFNNNSVIQFVQNGATSISLTLGNISRSSGTVDFTLPASGTVTTGSTTFASGGVLVSSNSNGIAFATVGGTDWATNTAGTIAALSTYAADNFATASNNVNVTTNDAPSAFTVNTLKFGTTGNTLTLNSSGASTISTGGILVPSGITATIDGSGSAAIRPGGGKELVVINNGTLEFKESITDSSSGASAVTLAGTGTTKFSATNSFTGVLTQLSSAATLNLNGVTQTLSSSSANVVNGLITGSGSLNKVGTGSLSIGNNANTFSGGLTVTGGSFTLGNGNTGTTVAGNAITSGPAGTGTLSLTSTTFNIRSNPITLANNVSVGGLVFLDGSGASYALTLDQTGVTGATGVTLTGKANLYNNNTSVTINDNITGSYDLMLQKVGASGGTTVAGSITNTGNLTLNNVGTALTVSGGVNNTGLVIGTGLSAGSSTISGVVGSNVTGVIQSNNNSRLVLSNTNTYTAPTMVYGGALQADNGVGLPTASNLLLDGGVLQNNSTTTFSRNLGTGGGQVQFGASGGFASGTGTLTVQLNGGTSTLQWGSGGFLANGAPLLLGSTSAGASSTVDFQNGLDLNGGAQTIQVTTPTSDTEKISGVISDSVGGGSLIKSGTGTLNLSNVETYTGATKIAAGTLKVLSNTGSLSSSSAVTFIGTGTLNVDNTGQTSGTRTPSLSTLTFSTGEGTIWSSRTAAFNISLTFSSLAARGAGDTGVFVVNGGTNGTQNKIVLTSQGTGFIDQGTFFGTSTTTPGNNYAWYDSGGFVRGINYGVDSGSTNITASQATVGSNQYVQVSSTGIITAQTTAAITTLQLANANSFTLAAGNTLTVNGILKSGNAGGGSVTGGTGIQAANNADLVVRTDGGSDTLTINTPILANGANNLVKSGFGTLTLTLASGVNSTYTGTTYANAGTLNIYGAGTVVPGNLVINGASVLQGDASTSVSPINTAANITLNAGSYRIQNGSQTIANFTVNGGSASSNANSTAATMTVNGTTTINGGSWSVGGNQASTWSTNTLLIKGGQNILQITSNNGSQTISVGSGGMEIDQPNTGGAYTALAINNFSSNTTPVASLTLNGDMKYVGSLTNATSTSITSSIASNNLAITLAAGAHNFDIGHGSVVGAPDLIVQPNIIGTGSLTKIGTGMMSYTGVGAYTGATTIQNGTLQIADYGSINTTSGITVDGANAIFRYSSAVALTRSVGFGASGGKFIYDSPTALTTLPTLSNGGVFVYNSSAKLGSALTVASGTTLGGSGTLGAVTVSGILSPGNSPGQMTVDSLLLNSGSTSHMEIGGTTLGTGYDNVTVANAGGLTYGGTLEIVSYAPYAINAQAGSYTLFSFTGGYSSELSSVTVDGFGLSNNSGVWTGTNAGISYSFTDSTGIFAVTIPEPASVSLMLGVASLGLLSRRRRKA